MFWELIIALVVVAIAILYTIKVIKNALTKQREQECILGCHLCQKNRPQFRQDGSSDTFSKYSIS